MSKHKALGIRSDKEVVEKAEFFVGTVMTTIDVEEMLATILYCLNHSIELSDDDLGVLTYLADVEEEK